MFDCILVGVGVGFVEFTCASSDQCPRLIFPPRIRSCSKVMFLHLCVILFTQWGGGYLSQHAPQSHMTRGVSFHVGSLSRKTSVRGVSIRGGLWPGGLCLGGVSVLGVSAQRGLCPGGLYPVGSLSRGSLSEGSLLGYSNEWTVRILLWIYSVNPVHNDTSNS